MAMCLLISVTSERRSSAASSIPPIWLYTKSDDSSTASEKIWMEYWPVWSVNQDSHMSTGWGNRANEEHREKQESAAVVAACLVGSETHIESGSQGDTKCISLRFCTQVRTSNVHTVCIDALRVKQDDMVRAAIACCALQGCAPNPNPLSAWPMSRTDDEPFASV